MFDCRLPSEIGDCVPPPFRLLHDRRATGLTQQAFADDKFTERTHQLRRRDLARWAEGAW